MSGDFGAQASSALSIPSFRSLFPSPSPYTYRAQGRISTPILSIQYFLPFYEAKPDAFLPSRVFRHAGRGGLCQSHIWGPPPTPRSCNSIRVKERPRCASAEPEIPEPIHELVLQLWRTGVRAGQARTVRRWKVCHDAMCVHPTMCRTAARE
jgi:hypothetical protein